MEELKSFFFIDLIGKHFAQNNTNNVFSYVCVCLCISTMNNKMIQRWEEGSGLFCYGTPTT